MGGFELTQILRFARALVHAESAELSQRPLLLCPLCVNQTSEASLCLGIQSVEEFAVFFTCLNLPVRQLAGILRSN